MSSHQSRSPAGSPPASTHGKIGTVALVIGYVDKDNAKAKAKEPVLVTALSDDQEILIFEQAINQGEENPLKLIQAFRLQQNREEEEFGDHVEDMLTRPGLKEDLRRHGIQWFQSKAKIDIYKHMETEATKVIADYAFEIFQADQKKKDFMLAGPNAEVRVRVFALEKVEEAKPAHEDAA